MKKFGVRYQVEKNRKLNQWSRPFNLVVMAADEADVQDFLWKRHKNRIKIIGIGISKKKAVNHNE